MSDSPILDFEQELRATFLALRTALLELFASVGEDPASPYPVSKRLGLDKSLVWKVAKVVQAEDAAGAVRHLPGQAGIQILLDGFRAAGSQGEVLEAVAAAARTVQTLVRDHSGDRATLELMLDSMKPEEISESSRKLAFRGNSGVWGVQARVRSSSFLLAPNASDPERVDVVLLSGFRRFQRLRPDLSWPLLRQRSYLQGDSRALARSGEPIDPAAPTVDGEYGLHFLTEFCTNPLPAVRRLDHEDSVVYELVPGPVGRQGAMDIFFGDIDRGLGTRWRDTEDDWVEMRSEINVPVEHMQLDLLVHRDLVLEREPTVELAGRLFGELPPPGDGKGLHTLPTDTKVLDLGPDALRLGSPLLPKGPAMLAWVLERLGWDPTAFRGFRATLAYPPLHTTAILRFRLPRRP